MATGISANKLELLQIADAVAREKGIEVEIVLSAMADAIQKAAKARYGAENDIRAKLDVQTGDLRLWRVVEVVDEVEDYFKQVDLKQAEKLGTQPNSGSAIHCLTFKSLVLSQIPTARSSLVSLKPLSATVIPLLSFSAIYHSPTRIIEPLG